MPDIQVDGKQAFYTTGGKPWEDGLPLALFVHAAGCNQSVWILQSRAIAHNGWNVAAVDLPGHGYSADDPSIASLEDYAAWLAKFVAALGVERVVAIGNSMGAGVVCTFAATYPELTAGMAMLGVSQEMAVNPGLMKDSAEDLPQAARFMSAYCHAQATHLAPAPTPGQWLLGSARALVEGCTTEVLHRDFQASHAWSGADYAGGVACPPLVISGGEDRMTSPRRGREMADAIPGAAHLEVPATGHFMMAEEPRKVLKALRAFLSEIPA